MRKLLATSLAALVLIAGVIASSAEPQWTTVPAKLDNKYHFAIFPRADDEPFDLWGGEALAMMKDACDDEEGLAIEHCERWVEALSGLISMAHGKYLTALQRGMQNRIREKVAILFELADDTEVIHNAEILYMTTWPTAWKSFHAKLEKEIKKREDPKDR